jgi:cystathionine beta-lyase/cystathionine gamma-synthase
METPDDLCPRPARLSKQSTEPHAPPIYLSSVYQCSDPDQADALLSGQAAGYVYGRDGHPNADLLAEKCRELHTAQRAAITSSGMAALALALLSQLEAGDHLIASNQLYGRTLTLLSAEAARLGIASSVIDVTDLSAVERALEPRTRLLFVETISNPLLRVANLAGLAEIAHRGRATLLADNTLAGPTVCRPLAHGADWVMESLTKSMNGHSDVILGLLCGPSALWQRVPGTLSTWGLASSPFDAWLAMRGLSTLGVRAERAAVNALAVAEFLAGHPAVAAVHYPGLPSHPGHDLAAKQMSGFGGMVSFTLAGGEAVAKAVCAATELFALGGSLGGVESLISYPPTMSHFPMQGTELAADPALVRLSVGIEAAVDLIADLDRALATVGGSRRPDRGDTPCPPGFT